MSLNLPNNLDEVSTYLQELVQEAGQILQTHFNTRQFTSRAKSGVDLVTQADEEADRFLAKQLQARYPGSHFLTEETAPTNHRVFADKDYLWVIDPLDGTSNFSRKHPHFAISIALLHRGQVQLGVVYLPIEGKLYQARSDQEGAYLNGKRITVSPTSELRETVFACDWAWDLETRQQIVDWLAKVSSRVRQIKTMGSAAADLASLAEGQIDAYVNAGLNPWDVAAAALLVMKAGGIITLQDGGVWSPFEPGILAATPAIHSQLLDLRR